MYVTQIYKYIFITNIRHRCSSSLPGGNNELMRCVLTSVVVIFIKNSEKIKQKNENS